MPTHEVTNQAPPRVNLNEFELNTPLVESVSRLDAGFALPALTEVGQLVGTSEFQADAETANTNTPVLHSHDRWGNRIDEVEYDESYHRIIGSAISNGAHSSDWATPKPGANVARAATFMLFAQIEPGHACPVSMTHAVVPSLLKSDELTRKWLPKVLSTDYDPTLNPAKSSAIFGMGMTEKQGGSDVKSNTTRAVANRDGSFQITGHKWFCSAPMSDAFLVLAQSRAGLSCFLLPRVLDDGTKNSFEIQRLKDKAGNRSNASCEVEFENSSAFLLGDEGRGVATIIEMVAQTRLDCIYGSAAGMRQSVAEALWQVRHRAAFGKLLIDQPVMTVVVADLALEAEAATFAGMRLARAHDLDASDQEIAFRRLATAVTKYWVCKRGPEHSYEAMECLGGNGYILDFPTARRFREQPVMAIWEGSGNVIALDVLRAIEKDPSTVDAFLSEVALADGEHAVFDSFLSETKRLLTVGLSVSDARRLTERLALLLEASLMLRWAPGNSADAFVRARLGEDRGRLYGVLPAGANLNAILARH